MATSKRVSFNGRDYKVEISGPVAKPDSFSVYSIEEIGGIFGEGTCWLGWTGADGVCRSHSGWAVESLVSNVARAAMVAS